MAELFVGRTTEQDEFRRVLDHVRIGGRQFRHAPDSPDEAHVVLVHGLGGIGKSTLLKRVREIAGEWRRGGSVVADIVDCEDEQRRYPSEYSGPDGPPIWRLLDRLYTAGADGGCRSTAVGIPRRAGVRGFPSGDGSAAAIDAAGQRAGYWNIVRSATAVGGGALGSGAGGGWRGEHGRAGRSGRERPR
jgi:hypothetical protein